MKTSSFLLLFCILVFNYSFTAQAGVVLNHPDAPYKGYVPPLNVQVYKANPAQSYDPEPSEVDHRSSGKKVEENKSWSKKQSQAQKSDKKGNYLS